jgi:hypothetical protein
MTMIEATLLSSDGSQTHIKSSVLLSPAVKRTHQTYQCATAEEAEPETVEPAPVNKNKRFRKDKRELLSGSFSCMDHLIRRFQLGIRMISTST